MELLYFTTEMDQPTLVKLLRWYMLGNEDTGKEFESHKGSFLCSTVRNTKKSCFD